MIESLRLAVSPHSSSFLSGWRDRFHQLLQKPDRQDLFRLKSVPKIMDLG